jgi:hypothetical protein
VIDPANRDHIMHIYGGGIWETTNASSATPTWNLKVNNLEETAILSVITPPAGAPYRLINSAGDIGTWVVTDLATKPVLGPTTNWSNGNSADMAWSDPLYIVGTGVASWSGAGGFGSGPATVAIHGRTSPRCLTELKRIQRTQATL